MAMEQQKCLEKELRESMKVIESSPSDFCRKTLEAVSVFLTAWAEIEWDDARSDASESDTKRAIPCGFVRDCMFKVQRLLGPGHEDLRKHVSSLLLSIETTDCQRMVLEFLPMTVPRNVNKNSLANSNKSKHRKAKKELLSSLRELLLGNNSLLKNGFQMLSNMVESSVLERKDAIEFSVKFLPKSPEEYLHVVIRALIQHSEQDVDALDAVDAIRTELALLRNTDVSDLFSIVTVFDESMAIHRCMTFVEQYISRCEEIADETINGKRQNERNHEIRLSVFDLTFLLLARGKDENRERIDSLLCGAIGTRTGLLLDLCPQKFFELVREQESPFDSHLVKRLVRAYVDVSLAMLISTFRIDDDASSQTIRSRAQDHVVSILIVVTPEKQKELVSKLILMLHRVMLRIELDHLNTDGIHFGSSKTPMQHRLCRGILSLFIAVSNENSGILIESGPQFITMLRSEKCLSHDPELIQSLCKLINVLTDTTRTSSLTRDYLVMVCRGLLFSCDNQPDPSESGKLRGLLLAKEIVGRSDFDSHTSRIIGGLVSRILGSSTGLNPRVGTHGVNVIHHIYLRKEVNAFDVKNSMGRILSRLRLVQYPKDQKIVPESRGVLVKYSFTPDFLQKESKRAQGGKFREMVFCFDAFLGSQPTLLHSSAWDSLCMWVYTLLRTYLTIGRPKKWIAQAWTEAGIEFPSPPSCILKSDDKSNLLHSWFEGFGSVQSFVESASSTPLEKILQELVLSLKKSSDRKALLEFSRRLALSLLLGVSLSAAVLNNVYDYFENYLLQDDSVQKCEAIALMQHQFFKIYDLKRTYQSMMRFFIALSKKRRKMGRGHNGKGSLNEEARFVAAQIQEASHRLFSSTTLISSEAIWAVLVDPSHDSAIICSLDPQTLKEAGDKTLLGILSMRLNLLCHLSCLNGTTVFESDREDRLKMNVISRRRVAQCLRLALFISRRLPTLKHAQNHDAQYYYHLLADVSREYLRLLRSLLVSTSGIGEGESPRASDVVFFFDLYNSLLGSKDPMTDAIELRGDGRELSPSDFKNLALVCHEHVRNCNAAVATELLDTLCVFATSMTKSSSETLRTMVDLSWASMSLTFNGEHALVRLSETPFALIEYLAVLRKVGSSEELLEALPKLIPVLAKQEEEEVHNYLAHVMCRHWGLLALSPKGSILVIDHLTRFLAELRGFLEDNDKPHEITVPVDYQTNPPPHSDSHGELGGEPDNQPTTSNQGCPRQEIPPSDSFPGLTSGSCTAYFDTLMKITVASIAIFSIEAEVMLSRSTSWNVHPFSHLETLFELCGSLLGLLIDNPKTFSGYFSAAMSQSLKLLLDVSVKKIHQCIAWRVTEPQLSAEEAASGKYDPAAKCFLKDLAQSFRIEVVGTLERLCAEKSNDHRMIVLHRKVDKACGYVVQLGKDFELGEIKASYSEDSDTDAEPRSKRRKTAIAPPRFDASTIDDSERYSSALPDAAVDRPVTAQESDSEYEEDEKSEDHTEASSSSGDFGVSGDWGQRRGEPADDSDDESSRQLGQVTVTH